MLNSVLVVQCPKCSRHYTEQQLKVAFIDGQKVTFKCQESNGEGCGSVIEADFFMESEFENKFHFTKLKRLPVKVGEHLAVTVRLRD